MLNLILFISILTYYPLGLETLVYSFMDALVPAYDGGTWDFFEVVFQNTSETFTVFLMVANIEDKVLVTLPDNYFSEMMSNTAASITACLFAYSTLAMQTNNIVITDQYHGLLAYAKTLPEFPLIARVID